MTRYVWNVALCEALYATIQHLEVALRNAIHNACTHEFGSDLWFDDPSLIDDPTTLRIIADAKGKLTHNARELRNRVFHHEPIFHWGNLHDHHREMHTVITWISPELAALAAITDRFPEVSAMDLAVLSSRLDSLVVGGKIRE